MTADPVALRREAMRSLAAAPGADLARLWAASGLSAEAELLRGPETGLVMTRGRIGGGGAAFNLGEATVTRASLRLATGEIGHAFALGRDAEKARLSALIDALLQRPEDAARVEALILRPLREAQAAAQARRAAEAAATRVEFFTLVRGEVE